MKPFLEALLSLLGAVVAAWLPLTLLALAAVVALLDGTLSNVAPAFSANGFLLTVFEFVAGAALVSVLSEATRSDASAWSHWLTAVGLVLLVGGFTSTVLGGSVRADGESAPLGLLCRYRGPGARYHDDGSTGAPRGWRRVNGREARRSRRMARPMTSRRTTARRLGSETSRRRSTEPGPSMGETSRGSSVK